MTPAKFPKEPPQLPFLRNKFSLGCRQYRRYFLPADQPRPIRGERLVWRSACQRQAKEGRGHSLDKTARSILFTAASERQGKSLLWARHKAQETQKPNFDAFPAEQRRLLKRGCLTDKVRQRLRLGLGPSRSSQEARLHLIHKCHKVKKENKMPCRRRRLPDTWPQRRDSKEDGHSFEPHG